MRLVLELLEALGGASEPRLEAIFRKYCPYPMPQGAFSPDEDLGSQHLGLSSAWSSSVARDFVGGSLEAGYVVTLPVAHGDPVVRHRYCAVSPHELSRTVIMDLVDETLRDCDRGSGGTPGRHGSSCGTRRPH